MSTICPNIHLSYYIFYCDFSLKYRTENVFPRNSVTLKHCKDDTSLKKYIICKENSLSSDTTDICHIVKLQVANMGMVPVAVTVNFTFPTKLEENFKVADYRLTDDMVILLII